HLANAITSFGREVLLWCRGFITAEGRAVLYGDTDSLFVASGAADADGARAVGAALAQRVNGALAGYIAERWRVASRLELQFDRLCLKLFLPPLRHGVSGARKRYAGLAADASGRTRVVFTGMEAVRGDWTELAKEVQRELYARLFAAEPVEDYLRQGGGLVGAQQADSRRVSRQ